MLVAALLILLAGAVGIGAGLMVLGLFRFLRQVEELTRQIRGFDEQVRRWHDDLNKFLG